MNEYAGRPSRLYYAAHMTEDLGGAKVYLKTRGSESHRRRTRSTTCSVRCCWRRRWERPVSSQRPEPDSTAWRQRQRQRSWAWSARVFMGEEDTEASGAERIQDASSRRKGPCGDFRDGYTEGCRFRDHERVDEPDRGYALCAGFRHGTASVPDYRA